MHEGLGRCVRLAWRASSHAFCEPRSRQSAPANATDGSLLLTQLRICLLLRDSGTARPRLSIAIAEQEADTQLCQQQTARREPSGRPKRAPSSEKSSSEVVSILTSLYSCAQVVWMTDADACVLSGYETASGSSPKPPTRPLGSSATIISIRAKCEAAARAISSAFRRKRLHEPVRIQYRLV